LPEAAQGVLLGPGQLPEAAQGVLLEPGQRPEAAQGVLLVPTGAPGRALKAPFVAVVPRAVRAKARRSLVEEAGTLAQPG